MKTLQNRNLEISLLAVITVAIFSLLAYLAYISPGIEGGMDSYNHYLIARYSWDYPTLFLDQWGKPIYNLIASLFTQFGISGAIVLNCLSLFGCSVLVYKTIKRLGFNFAWLGYVLCITSPIFLDNTISSLTEPLCALLVSLTIYLYADKKHIASACLAGFLPYARSEGFIILFAVVLFLIFVDKQYKSIAFAFVGSLFFNFLGWAIQGEALWIFTSNPYINFELSGLNICGSGGISHYYYARHYTFGLVSSFLIASGSLIYAIRFMVNRKTTISSMGLIVISFILYFGSHVMIWWLGKMGSCGYVRVMVVIAPLGAIIMVYAIHTLAKKMFYSLGGGITLLTQLSILFIVINSIYTPYRYYAYKYPLQITEEQKEYVKLADWYKKQNYTDRRKIYLYPYFSLIAEINPYDKEEHLDFWASSLDYTKKGDILIWDSHFGPYESGTPLHSLEVDSTWQRIYAMIPSEPIYTTNNKQFEIHVFEKIK